jgi:Ferredoxin-like domain in Api92-like protein
MANICSINLNLGFRTPEAKTVFMNEFNQKIAEAKAKHEGVRLAESKWLFDSCIEDRGESSAEIYGSTRWCLEHESIREFTEYLESMQILSFECSYEETGCLIYGKYCYENGELSDCHLDQSNPIWERVMEDEDDYFNDLDDILEAEGTTEMVA